MKHQIKQKVTNVHMYVMMDMRKSEMNVLRCHLRMENVEVHIMNVQHERWMVENTIEMRINTHGNVYE